ncbi:MAG: hypothetical protein HY459_02015, partial [Parcubacteria group bacterium]|nr:hypothetical protein [Parcubacteria group bacterium]
DSLRLTYNDADGSAANYTDFSLGTDGDLTIDSSGGNINLSDVITISPATTGTHLDFALETEWTFGTLINADFASGTTQGAGDIIGLQFDFDTNLTGTVDRDITGVNVIANALVATDTAVTTTYTGYNISAAGALDTAVGDVGAAVINWRGMNVTMPAIDSGSTADIVTSIGLLITGGTVTDGLGTENQYGISLTDNLISSVGTDRDIAIVLNSAGLAADTALTNVLEGTVEAQAIAANSLVISNQTNDGDIALYVSKAGNSQQVFFADGSTGDTAVMAASGQSVDIYIAGTKELDYDGATLSLTGAHTISTTAGDLTLNPATGEDVIIPVSKGLVIGNTAQITVGGTIDRASAGVPELQILSGGAEIGNADTVTIGSFNATNNRAATLNFTRSRNATIGSNTIVVSGDNLGTIIWTGDDSADFQSVAAFIAAESDGTPGVGDMPGRLLFATTADEGQTATERMRINNAGVVILGRGEGGTVLAVGNTFRAPDITTGGAGNIAGADLTIAAGLGTGTGDEGQIIFSLPIVATAGDNIQTTASRLVMDMAGSTTALTFGFQQATTISTTTGNLTLSAAGYTDVRSASATAGRAFNVSDANGDRWFSIAPDTTLTGSTLTPTQIIGIDARTINSTASNPTTFTSYMAWQYRQVALTGTNPNQVFTTASTVVIAGPPTASGNASITAGGAYALWVDVGTSRFDGDAIVGGSTSATETLANAGFVMGGDDLFVAGLLGVEGNVYTDGSFITGASTTYADGTITKSTGGALSVALGGAAGDDFIVDTTTLVVESDNDRVGIGTTSPLAPL